MCGIVGYVGPRKSEPLLIDALKRLEYRGYDSCGIAVLDNGSSRLLRTPGRIARLEELLGADGSGAAAVGSGAALADAARVCGIGHTRWATHGAPNEANAHPHTDCSGRFIVVHNGIIENHDELKVRLIAAGHEFRTQTDTEVLPHLVESHFEGCLVSAVRAALREVDGQYGCVFMSPEDGAKLVVARKGAPLVIGSCDGEYFVASDAPALLPHTRDLIFLEDGEIAVLHPGGVELYDDEGERIQRAPQRVDWSAEMAEKQGYPHFMLKEIHEQPRAVADTLSGRVRDDGRITLEEEAQALERLDHVERIQIVACGTSLHAGLIGRRLLESWTRLPVDVDYASEFRYREPLIDENSLVLGISQSGETADTLSALKEAGERGAELFAVCNVVGSSITRQCHGVLYTHAGPEIGVASTKAFLTQLAALHLVALKLAEGRGTVPEQELRRRALALRELPDRVAETLARSDEFEAAAGRLAGFENCLYLGRGISYPVAMEGALKLKEIAYIHAEGYPSGEMKHGPIALLDEEMCVVALAPRDSVYRKTMSNIEESRVRGARLLVVATDGDEEMAAKADETLLVPESDPFLSPFLTTIPLQLLAYHAGVARGCDVDKPRNLAKSVTVE